METPAGEDSKQRFKEMRVGNGEGCIEGDSLSGTTDVWRVGLEGQNEVSDQEISGLQDCWLPDCGGADRKWRKERLRMR